MYVQYVMYVMYVMHAMHVVVVYVVFVVSYMSCLSVCISWGVHNCFASKALMKNISRKDSSSINQQWGKHECTLIDSETHSQTSRSRTHTHALVSAHNCMYVMYVIDVMYVFFVMYVMSVLYVMYVI